MTNINKTANEYFLTQAQFNARKQAGTLEVGAVYHITDVHSGGGTKLYRHDVMVQTTSYEVRLSFLSPYSTAIDDHDLFEGYAPIVTAGAYVNDSIEYGNVTVYANYGAIIIMGRNVSIGEDILIQDALSNYTYTDTVTEL